MAEQVWRPRRCVRAQRSGSPQVSVRPYYEGPPSQEGQTVRMKGGESRPDRGGRKSPGSDPTRRSRGGRRHSGAPGGGVPRGTRHRKVPKPKTVRRTALRSLTL